MSEEAFRIDDDWCTLVWLVMTTGMRRGELAALRFSHIDLDQEVVRVHRNWVRGKEKDTKTHQRRRIALDSETVALLREQRDRVAERVGESGAEFRDDLFVFSSVETPDHTGPYAPNAMTPRYRKRRPASVSRPTYTALRPYSATELPTAGVDLPTVSGRLGHGGEKRRR